MENQAGTHIYTIHTSLFKHMYTEDFKKAPHPAFPLMFQPYTQDSACRPVELSTTNLCKANNTHTHTIWLSFHFGPSGGFVSGWGGGGVEGRVQTLYFWWGPVFTVCLYSWWHRTVSRSIVQYASRGKHKISLTYVVVQGNCPAHEIFVAFWWVAFLPETRRLPSIDRRC